MKKTLLMLAALLFGLNLFAGIPEGYYQGADSKSSLDLKDALREIISDHKNLGYSSLWDYYPFTYYVIGNPEQVLDMYSDEVTYFSNTNTMNKEHTVPKSWWGGNTGSGPGCDIFNVIPSEQRANSAKSNYPLGIVSGQPTFDNGVTKIGKSGVEGYNGNVFEPKDEYKGDFARIYFYVATCYPNLSWDSNNAYAMTNETERTLKSWITQLLLDWHAMDPVDNAEIQRNEDIYTQQGNRNPFIDYPSLCEYIWGGKQDYEYVFAEHEANQGETHEQHTLVPTFDIDYGTEDNPKNVVDGTVVTVTGGTSKSMLYTRVNGEDWVETPFSTNWNSNTQTEYHTSAKIGIPVNGSTLIEAYCSREGYMDSETVNAYYKGVDFDEDFLLHEEFDGVTAGNNNSTSGSSSAWAGNPNFPTVTNIFSAGNAVKMGSGKSTGKLVSRTLNTNGGTITVELDVKGWTAVEGKLDVSLTGAENQIVSYDAVMDGDFEHVSLTFNDVAANPVLTIATTAKRAFVDNISVTQNTTSNTIKIADADVMTPVYNIHGQRVGANYRGIVIVGGRKYTR